MVYPLDSLHVCGYNINPVMQRQASNMLSGKPGLSWVFVLRWYRLKVKTYDGTTKSNGNWISQLYIVTKTKLVLFGLNSKHKSTHTIYSITTQNSVYNVQYIILSYKWSNQGSALYNVPCGAKVILWKGKKALQCLLLDGTLDSVVRSTAMLRTLPNIAETPPDVRRWRISPQMPAKLPW